MLRPLVTPQARKDSVRLLPPPPPAPLTLGALSSAASAAWKEMWVSFHWVEANEFLAPEARESATARAAFAAGAHPDDLRVPLGGVAVVPGPPHPLLEHPEGRSGVEPGPSGPGPPARGGSPGPPEVPHHPIHGRPSGAATLSGWDSKLFTRPMTTNVFCISFSRCKFQMTFAHIPIGHHPDMALPICLFQT